MSPAKDDGNTSFEETALVNAGPVRTMACVGFRQNTPFVMPDNSDDKKCKFNPTWLAIGVGVGVAIGMGTKNLALGIAIGMALGIGCAVSIPSCK